MSSIRTLYVKLTNAVLTVRSGGSLSVLSGGTFDIDDGAIVTAPYDTYSNDWNGDLSIPTKHDIYTKIETISAGGGAWGSITGTLSAQTDLQAALDAKADDLGADDNYVTDAEKVKLSNLSGTNSGDQTSIVGITGSLAEFNAALTGADFATGGGTVTGASSGTNTGDDATNSQYSGLDAAKQNVSAKNQVNGYPGMSVAGGIEFDMAGGAGVGTVLTHANTAAHVYTFQDRDGVIADDTDLAGKQPLDAQLTSLAGLSYAGNTLKVVRVNAGETAFELATISGSGLTQPQVMARCCGC